MKLVSVNSFMWVVWTRSCLNGKILFWWSPGHHDINHNPEKLGWLDHLYCDAAKP